MSLSVGLVLNATAALAGSSRATQNIGVVVAKNADNDKLNINAVFG
jgi:hypothetical protein